MSILNPFRVKADLHEDADLSGPFLFLMAFGLFQLLAGKLHFGIILRWVTVASLFLYVVFNMLAGRNGNLDLYRCLSLIGYCQKAIKSHLLSNKEANLLDYRKHHSMFLHNYHCDSLVIGGVALGLANPTLGIFIKSEYEFFLIQLAGGNSALALAMTVPFSVSKLIAGGVGASVPADQLFKSLVVTLLIPLILGKTCKSSSLFLPFDRFHGNPLKVFILTLPNFQVFMGCVADFSDRNHKLLSNLSALLLSLVPWIQVSRSRSLLLAVKPSVFLVAVASSPHTVGLQCSFNTNPMCCGSKSVFAKKENASALLLVASQVTFTSKIAI
ncbi:hypothetical protein L1987_10652 [Smallanthus sonchifolius]|uniref:Uncharacterized protein n=1 Tax=Smallanthus sonchifolius TaxID=185202 RepID=A0ACB9JA88_9ASTR|nr:hypothetical protein L1987_10652 [Smallanthus sonchifolius]